VHRQDSAGAHPGVVERITHLGFEVRVDIRMEGGGPTWVQFSRGAAAELALAPSDRVWISRPGPRANGRIDATSDSALAEVPLG
jgi:hypothetical protein